MPPIYDKKLIEEVDEMISKLKQMVEQAIKLRVSCAQCEIELAVLHHTLCLEILESTDKFTASHNMMEH